MTERKPANVSWGDWVERQIRQAQQNGSFDHLPGHGKPIAGLREPEQEGSWIAAKLRRENVDIAALLPPALALAKEVEDLPQRLLREKSESAVRSVIDDLNERIRQAHRRPQTGPPLRVMPRDPEPLVAAWRAGRTRPV